MKNNRADIHYRIARFEQKRSNRGGIYYRMARFEQYNLHPGRNRHYQSGRQRDPWHLRQRMVMDPCQQTMLISTCNSIFMTLSKKSTVHTTLTVLPLPLKTLMTLWPNVTQTVAFFLVALVSFTVT